MEAPCGARVGVCDGLAHRFGRMTRDDPETAGRVTVWHGSGALGKAAIVMANELRADAIITFVRGGTMTRYLSWFRPKYSTIFAVGPSEDVLRRMTLNRGVVPIAIPLDQVELESNIALAIKTLVEKRYLRAGNTVVIVSFIMADSQIVDAVQMRVV